ncbi:peptide-methionine (S)-S-oxide reductase MsrA [Methanocalculus sp.]|uniref:peptide-methionine (S)-S-oxide reductase MsrA n=1 Tax=Methanocalculus sp. TaxID=2004547 RepID=UPI00261DEB9B|nr:peptide-methionine (S)-S-oxide reductase MsrA [Methanocalculus sp.]MDG6251374.1 peptide-methionine (S)-S-oxide reductase MsrA [Methanocalculus sp.]
MPEHEIATFAAGCFWGVEAAFADLAGVISTRVGYTGGTVDNPTYEEVCTGRTGHAEAVEVTYDPALVTYDHLLIRFWSIHDPTTKDRQGPDTGSQYRSAIFTHSKEQEDKANASRERMDRSGRFGRPIVTEILPAAHFWPAEEYHQQYFRKHGHSCGIGF